MRSHCADAQKLVPSHLEDDKYAEAVASPAELGDEF